MTENQVFRLIFAAVLLLLIAACDRPEPVSSIVQGATPPKPPNCPALPELANLQLKDRGTADVRIVQDEDLTLYIPSDWLRHPSEYPMDFYAGFSDPKVEDIECPGVIHKSISGIDFRLPFRLKPATDVAPMFSPGNHGGGTGIYFDTPHNTFSEKHLDEFCVLSLGGSLALIRITQKYHIYYDFPLLPRFFIKGRPGTDAMGGAYLSNVMASPEWRLWRAAALDVVTWLRTPPKDRDNDRNFRSEGYKR